MTRKRARGRDTNHSFWVGRSGSQQRAAGYVRKCFTHGLAGDGRVVVGLSVKPPSIAAPKVPAQPKVGVGGDGPLAGDDVTDPLRRHADVLGQAVFRQAKGLEKFIVVHFAGGNGTDGTHGRVPSVVIHVLNILRPLGGPDKAPAPLREDPELATVCHSERLSQEGGAEVRRAHWPIQERSRLSHRKVNISSLARLRSALNRSCSWGGKGIRAAASICRTHS